MRDSDEAEVSVNAWNHVYYPRMQREIQYKPKLNHMNV